MLQYVIYKILVDRTGFFVDFLQFECGSITESDLHCIQNVIERRDTQETLWIFFVMKSRKKTMTVKYL